MDKLTFKTQIKYTAGDEVYWLSSDGFVKGVVKTVQLIDNTETPRIWNTHRKEIRYYLWHKNNCSIYQGDLVPEDKIFDTYESMIEYYSKQGENY